MNHNISDVHRSDDALNALAARANDSSDVTQSALLAWAVRVDEIAAQASSPQESANGRDLAWMVALGHPSAAGRSATSVSPVQLTSHQTSHRIDYGESRDVRHGASSHRVSGGAYRRSRGRRGGFAMTASTSAAGAVLALAGVAAAVSEGSGLHLNFADTAASSIQQSAVVPTDPVAPVPGGSAAGPLLTQDVHPSSPVQDADVVDTWSESPKSSVAGPLQAGGAAGNSRNSSQRTNAAQSRDAAEGPPAGLPDAVSAASSLPPSATLHQPGSVIAQVVAVTRGTASPGISGAQPASAGWPSVRSSATPPTAVPSTTHGGGTSGAGMSSHAPSETSGRSTTAPTATSTSAPTASSSTSDPVTTAPTTVPRTSDSTTSNTTTPSTTTKPRSPKPTSIEPSRSVYPNVEPGRPGPTSEPSVSAASSKAPRSATSPASVSPTSMSSAPADGQQSTATVSSSAEQSASEQPVVNSSTPTGSAASATDVVPGATGSTSDGE